MRWLWAREPLVHFALAGGVIFCLNAARSSIASRQSIVVTPEIVEGLIKNRQTLLGRPVSSDEQRQLVEEYINEEVLIREGYARGIDKQDRLVQQRLLEIMRFLLEEEPPEPSPSDLQTFLQAHEPSYRIAEKLSFSQVFFPRNGEDSPDGDLLPRLRQGADYTKLGDRFWLGPKIENYSETDLTPLFGQEFVSAIRSLPLHQWSGPIESSQGVHFVRVDTKYPPRVPAFDSITSTLRTDWLNWKRGQALNQKVDDLRKHYRVEVKTGTSVK